MRVHLICYLFGHGDCWLESGYPVCNRCGAHSYYNSRHIDPETPIDWDSAGVLLRPYWKARDALYRWRERRKWLRGSHDDLPF